MDDTRLTAGLPPRQREDPIRESWERKQTQEAAFAGCSTEIGSKRIP